jgi:hypothetical protein
MDDATATINLSHYTYLGKVYTIVTLDILTKDYLKYQFYSRCVSYCITCLYRKRCSATEIKPQLSGGAYIISHS